MKYTLLQSDVLLTTPSWKTHKKQNKNSVTKIFPKWLKRLLKWLKSPYFEKCSVLYRTGKSVLPDLTEKEWKIAYIVMGQVDSLENIWV